MSGIKVRIDMDEGWMWWPIVKFPDAEHLEEHLKELGDDEDLKEFVRKKETPSMEVPPELLAEYLEASQRYFAINKKLEQLYRIQEGLEPWPEQEIPVYNLIKT